MTTKGYDVSETGRVTGAKGRRLRWILLTAAALLIVAVVVVVLVTAGGNPTQMPQR